MKFELDIDRNSVADEVLLNDLAAVARHIGSESPSMTDYRRHGHYHPSTLAKRFGSWTAALERAGLTQSRYNAGIDADAAVADLRAVASRLNKSTVTQAEYSDYGKFSANPFLRIFGSWNAALKAAGLEASRRYRVGNDELFEDLERMWTSLGRQPTYAEVVKPFSQFSAGTYVRRFGSWRKALESFVAYMNAPDAVSSQAESGVVSLNQEPPCVHKRRTSRNVNWRLRFLVMRRDGFRCCLCGASPAVDRGVTLQVDHIQPWSEGGETVIENLQTCCEQCNVGKSSLPVQENAD